MNAATRLAIYALILVALFAVAYVLGGLLVPDGVVQSWMDSATTHGHAH